MCVGGASERQVPNSAAAAAAAATEAMGRGFGVVEFSRALAFSAELRRLLEMTYLRAAPWPRGAFLTDGLLLSRQAME